MMVKAEQMMKMHQTNFLLILFYKNKNLVSELQYIPQKQACLVVNLTFKACIFQKQMQQNVWILSTEQPTEQQTYQNKTNKQKKSKSGGYKLTWDPRKEQPLPGHQISHIPSVDVVSALYFVCKSPVTFNASLMHLFIPN